MKAVNLGFIFLWAFSTLIMSTHESVPLGDAKYEQSEKRRENFQAARELLLKANAPFDADILLSPDWQKTLAPIFAQLPEKQKKLHETDQLQGVYFADTLTLPAKVSLTGDTVIVVRQLIYLQKDSDPDVIIKGNYKIFIFTVEGAKILDTNGVLVKKGRIIIDTTGINGKNGSSGKKST